MPLYLRAPLPLIAALAVGCTTPVVDDVADANAAMTDGVVLVERVVAADGAAQTYVSAKFMRLGTPADPELAERMVGSTLDLPEVGTCRRLAADRMSGKTPALGSLGAIELIDVGDVTLRTGPSAMTLAARAFPDVGDLVSGMFYTSRDSTSDLPVGATYLLEGSGSGAVERFAIEAEAPAAPEDVRVGDVALGEGPVIGASTSALLHWRAAEPVTMGGTPKPPAQPVTMGEPPKPPVTMGGTPKPPARGPSSRPALTGSICAAVTSPALTSPAPSCTRSRSRGPAWRGAASKARRSSAASSRARTSKGAISGT